MSGDGSDSTERPDDQELLAFFRAIAARDLHEVARVVGSSPRFAVWPIHIGASRADPSIYFLDTIRHHVYSGDTALHIAAAADLHEAAELLIANEAGVRARNRRGAEPLHYAADGVPEAASWNPDSRYSIIEYLIANGADPNAVDNSGVAALHRAVRKRSSGAVRALLDNGANPTMKNKSGSTPLHLAVQNTGSSNSGTTAAKVEQRRIIELLQRHGARPSDSDAEGKTVIEAATSDWIRELLV